MLRRKPDGYSRSPACIGCLDGDDFTFLAFVSSRSTTACTSALARRFVCFSALHVLSYANLYFVRRERISRRLVFKIRILLNRPCQLTVPASARNSLCIDALTRQRGNVSHKIK